MKQFILFVGLMVSTFGAFSQEKSTNELLVELSEFGSTISTTNFDGSKSEQVILLEQLIETATPEELMAGLQHKQPIARLFSYWAIPNKDELDFTKLVLTETEKEQEVTIINGCFVEKTTLGQLFKQNGSILSSSKQNLPFNVITTK